MTAEQPHPRPRPGAPRWVPSPELPQHWPPPLTENDLEEYRRELCAPLVDYERAFVTTMADRYGPDWATNPDLPDEAFTAEIVYDERVNALHDHVERTAGQQLRDAAVQRHLDRAADQLREPTAVNSATEPRGEHR